MKVIILAAGAGKRMHSESEQLPKVLRRACGKPLISYPLQLLGALPKKDVVIVTGFMREKVMAELGNEYSYAVQEQQNGTGHAVACALPALEGYNGPVMIINGDMPLLKSSTIEGIAQLYKNKAAACALLAADVKETSMPYGRIVRNNEGRFERIVEDRDCTPEQKQITELNVGVYVFDAELMRTYLRCLSNNNAQGEYYLTDLPEMLAKDGRIVEVYVTNDITEAYGVNTPDDLLAVEKLLMA